MERKEKQVDSIQLTYSLTYDEAFTAFLLLSQKLSKKMQIAIGAILVALAAVFVFLYARNPYNLEYFVIPLLCVLTFFGIIYYPRAKAANGAKKVERLRGVYKVEVFLNGFIKVKDQDRIRLQNDKVARAYETEEIFVVRPDRINTFCFPKRLMSETDKQTMHDVLNQHMKKFSVITLK